MTELLEAIADVGTDAKEQRLLRVAAALYQANRVFGVKQTVLVVRTGYTRETIRRHVEDERIRRGEIDPTPRYLKEQERRARRAAQF
jgi:predicted transcriptional regulator